jgi:hypothetical protein
MLWGRRDSKPLPSRIWVSWVVHTTTAPLTPERTKVLLAIDSWCSQNKVAFMAMVAYYISVDYIYREVLLACEPLMGARIGCNLVQVF